MSMRNKVMLEIIVSNQTFKQDTIIFELIVYNQ